MADWRKLVHILLSRDSDDNKARQVLDELHMMQTHEPSLFKNAAHRIQLRAGQDIARRTRLATYTGPDEATIQLLEARRDEWFEDPDQFFQQESHVYGSSSPFVLLNAFYDHCVADRDIV
ncbi:hypothetical protein C1H76_0654 [Elsinoe australis]|uniref:Uncharacterized protein n=1 Tax=Elsinoe australis TaxID=40998 RepID=A0A4U7BG00_9PEZI|nr:hypothetical protein C1H76_0654 [Elsinoe australis]